MRWFVLLRGAIWSSCSGLKVEETLDPGWCMIVSFEGTPPGGYPWLKSFDSTRYDFVCLQNLHYKWVTGKIVFLKGLWVLMGKPRLLAGAFFDSVLSITDWVKLLRHADVVCLHGVKWFGGLTSFFGGSLQE